MENVAHATNAGCLDGAINLPQISILGVAADGVTARCSLAVKSPVCSFLISDLQSQLLKPIPRLSSHNPKAPNATTNPIIRPKAKVMDTSLSLSRP